MNVNDILLSNLTQDQYNAVVDASRNVLCLACAGSGKSRTLAYKIAYLISQGVSPESIVAFTFTEKAADSIKRRVAETLHKFGYPENYIGAMFIGTIDSFCQKLLGNIDASFRQYDILDQNGLILFVMSRYGKLGIPHGQGYFKTIKEVTDAWQTANNEYISLEDIRTENPLLGNILLRLKDAFMKDGYMDFSFAIRLATEELKKIEKKEGTDIEKYRFLFVDEYQDINPIQEEFIQTFSHFMDMLFVVGDDDQAIYGWRGANVQNILTFADRYENVSVHRLLVNFRSTKAIVETANSFVQANLNFERLPKDISSNSDGNIQDLRKLWFADSEDEAEWIAERIATLIGTTYIEYNPDGSEKSRRGLTYSDFAILLRSIRNSNGENRDVRFVNALKKRGIPVKTTGEGGIFDRPYAQYLLDTMELLRSGNADRSDAETLFKNSIISVFPYADKTKYLNVLQYWNHQIHAPAAGGARRKVYPQQLFHDLLDALMLRAMNDETAYRDLGLFSKIILDVEQTYVSIDSPSRYSEMLNFFQNIAKNSYELEPIDYISKDNAVNISTIHKVKGLEFPVVFVADLVNQRFPGKTEQYSGAIPKKLMDKAIARGAYGSRVQDEARLFYPDDLEISEWLNNLDYYEESDDNCKWRPFQIAFLLMDINAIVQDNCSDRSIVDLIWFPTGGGKTEAYLGLTAFTIFYRKLAHPGESSGTAVMMRYTLRLLAAQQFTRAATLICACEYIRQDCMRKKHRYPAYPLGRTPITIGLWIGGTHIPNKNTGDKSSAEYHLNKLQNVSHAYSVRNEKERHNKFQVLKCPWCGTKLVKDDKDGRLVGEWGYAMNGKHFYMFCPHEDCDFTKRLPIQIIDEELYATPPTLLFGTVDKFAMMAWDGRVGAFFGLQSEDRSPELIIQDELHLISGALGTMVGLYETAVDGLSSMKGIKPKVIASTATIRRAKEQCSALYNREVVQFPAPGLDAEDSFFAKEDTIDYGKGKYGRKYVGIMPSGRTKAMTEIRAMAALLQEVFTFNLPDEVKDKLWTLTVYFNSLRDLGKASTLVDDDVKDFIIRTANRMFTSRRLIVNSDELTSRVTTTELNETLDKLEKVEYSKENMDAKKYASNVLLATNMISVGIDVARLNVMLMIGQPKLTSEYIQASSRVGRSFPGVAFIQ